MSRGCCCADCLIWEYTPGDLGSHEDPPWYVESGAIEVVDNGGLVLKLDAGTKMWHRIPDTYGPHGRLDIHYTHSGTTGARHRAMFNGVGPVDKPITQYFMFENIPWPTGIGGDPANGRFYKELNLLIDLEIDAPRYWALQDVPDGGLGGWMVPNWRCKGVDGKSTLEEETLIEGLTVQATLYATGRFVGIWSPDEIIYISSINFWQALPDYTGKQADCMGCHCARCDVNDTGETGESIHQNLTVTYESSCVALDGASYTIEPDPLDNDPADREHGDCGGFLGADDALSMCYIVGLDSFPTSYLAASGGGINPKEWPISVPACGVSGNEPIQYPNANSTCNPFYLEYGPLVMGVYNPEDPPEEWFCCCPGCDLDECEWFTIKVTR